MPSPPDNDSSDEMDVECNDILSSEQQPSSGGKRGSLFVLHPRRVS